MRCCCGLLMWRGIEPTMPWFDGPHQCDWQVVAGSSFSGREQVGFIASLLTPVSDEDEEEKGSSLPNGLSRVVIRHPRLAGGG